ncbi:hypothetical protein A3D62_02545 [Candidatus Kaiserbacteria bacterium RIFCSPHIGHO2_02_FULL_49_11]|uniref:Major facilitator superfamily (MFS) profile domain-containing protein n=1 Tax=Candidatus Kaiserbacteria bacterium RIFCSPHIGHO2_02_FULL_49_11 TaxID=1798489 RepID=A0A1F6D0T5_9BACT|nr:MAG: hypothetical protein A3D62_02545 [Candidatus Kaiserbacteria bacterium RIFCSPHIGHO2_02_FULL_49_11]
MKLSIRDYQGVSFSFDVLALYCNRLLIQFGFGVVGIFEVIFLFNQFDSNIPLVALIYASIFLLSVILTPFGAMLISLFGMKRLMILSIPFAFCSILSLFLWDLNPLLALFGLIFSTVIYKTLYWVPYHVDFAKFSDKKTRGRQLSILLAVSEIVTIITPLIGGAIITASGYSNLFIVSLGILLFAVIPLFFIQEKYETFSYSYWETYTELFSKKNRSLLLGYTGDGAQSGVTLLVWPIFIFMLLRGEYLVVGAISSITILALLVLRFVVGDLVDRWSRKKVLTIGTLLNTTGWLVKVFIETGFQIFIIDTYHGLGKVVNQMSVDVTTYNQATDNGHYIDEFTVLKEMAVNAGKTLILLVVGVVIFFYSLKVAFVIAAVASLFVTLLNKEMMVGEKKLIVPEGVRQ